jgi:predicted RNase H-like HicB family nuclease
MIMDKMKIIIEWASDGTLSAMLEKDMFAGMGETVEAAVADLRNGVAFYIETAKEMGFPYKDYLDGEFEVELEYDAVSMLKYAREYIKDTKLAELTGIAAVQIGRYANDKAQPRPAQRRKIVEALHKFATPFYAITL